MDIENDVLYKKTFHKLTGIKPMENMDFYNKFLNWTAGEFDLYLQEDTSGLKVHQPNGYFTLQKLILRKDLNVKITVYNRSMESCRKTYFKLEAIYGQIEALYRFDQFILNGSNT